MRKYENRVQKIKNEVYAKVSEYAFNGRLTENMFTIPMELNQGPNASLRCCVYHERAVTAERVQMSMGGHSENTNIIEVLESACDQCTEHRYVVTEACRGCLAHRCQHACPVQAISFINNRAIIDYEKCIECGRCNSACPYNAISDVLRPCLRVCPTKAIAIDEHKKAVIDETKCIRCGACVYSCPFGAMQDKSELLAVIDLLKSANRPIYAMMAPAIATQFEDVSLGQVVTAIKSIGFKDAVEVALGADMVAVHEAKEFVEHIESNKGFMTTSCCPAFVRYVYQEFPELKKHISTTVSPMVATARLIKSIDSEAAVVFVGPCIAKKEEEKFLDLPVAVDHVLTFEELIGIVRSGNMDVASLESSPLNNASYFGRNFAASGGVAKAVQDILKIKKIEAEYELMVCNGLAECKKALTQAKHGRLGNVFIEGMACEGGCIKGPVTMQYGPIDRKKLENYCKEALEAKPEEAINIFLDQKISLIREGQPC
jgi:[FeFe] hydrogenase (group B1/B3)